uniref:Uncharacterized protein n=1 Tax=Cannabis sativa TaxID=3483 RepID=A0A803PPL0_CANSA
MRNLTDFYGTDSVGLRIKKQKWLVSDCPVGLILNVQYRSPLQLEYASPKALVAGSPRVLRPQLNVVLVVARFLSKGQDSADLRPKAVVLEFLRSILASFNQSFWPQAFGTDAITSFFVDFLGYVWKVVESSPDSQARLWFQPSVMEEIWVFWLQLAASGPLVRFLHSGEQI